MIRMSPTATTVRHHAPKPGNSFADRHPALSSSWDAETNGTLGPEDVTHGSGRIVAWICESHGSYDLQVCQRAAGRGCPTCGRLRLQAPRHGKSLAEAFPDVAALWDYEANHPLTPADVAPRSNRKAFFRCPEGHPSAEAFISNRTAGNGCLDCGNVRSGMAKSVRAAAERSLVTIRPDIAAEWNTELNTIGPDQVSPSSRAVAWWNCTRGSGHPPYQARVEARQPGRGCPECARISRADAIRYKGPEAGRSLAELRPEIAADWDTDLNTLTAAGVAPYSRTTAHWVCASGHRSEERIDRRTANGGCRACPVDQRPGRQAA